MVEVRLQIPSLSAPGTSTGSSHGRRREFWIPHRRANAISYADVVTRAGAAKATAAPKATPAPVAKATPAPVIAATPSPNAVTMKAFLFNMPDNGWLHRGFDGHGGGKPTFANLTSQARD